jgi:hypothetical protein
MSFWNSVKRKKPGVKGHVVAHILDPITGYSNRDLQVGKDIDADTIRRLGDSAEVFVVVDYEGGVASANLCKRAQWLRTRAEQVDKNRTVDVSVWRRREELKIG